MTEERWPESRGLAGASEAWSRYDIWCRGNQWVVYWTTNDDEDRGYPTTYASDRRVFATLDGALKWSGKSRQGIACRVIVTVNGERV